MLFQAYRLVLEREGGEDGKEGRGGGERGGEEGNVIMVVLIL